MFFIFNCRFFILFCRDFTIFIQICLFIQISIDFLSGNVHNQPENPQEHQNPQEPQKQNPPQEEQIPQSEPIARPPPGTQENLRNEIERGKTELEGIIARLKESRQTNPMRAQLASSLKSINTQIASVSGQLDIWRAKRDEQKRSYANKLSYEDVKKKEIPKSSIFALFRKPDEQNTVREGTK